MEIYDRLLQFTLFQGMSHADLMEVVGHTKFDFTKTGPGTCIARGGDPCTHLFFLVNGSLHAETTSDDNSCRVCETLRSPYVLQPERIFGITQRYSSTFKTLTDCNFITIDKQEVMLLMET
ncbi:MAG: cyclic nucleotide-binding domain-containing protein, partial [Prevotella sp.]|nr:cyclic nucleotide-binding domain-containing protein [Prevotella sp.]